MFDATLLYIFNDKNEVLLGIKKRKLGAGLLNGFGGKVEPNETIEQAAIREVKEECGVLVTKLEKVAELTFYFSNPDHHKWNQVVHVYFSKHKEWSGIPIETDEMIPGWYALAAVPYHKMWEDDKLWLAPLLQGKKLKGELTFNDDNSSIQKYSLNEVKSF